MDGIVGGCGRGVFSGRQQGQIVTSFGGVRWGFGSVRGYGELQTCCLENSRQSFDGRIATR